MDRIVAATLGYDVANVPSGGALHWSGTAPINCGELDVAVDGTFAPGSCTIKLGWSDAAGVPGTGAAWLTGGTQVYTFGAAGAPIKLTSIEIACGGGTGTIDWLAVQNGRVTFAPPEDLEVAWSDVRLQFGGYETQLSTRPTLMQDAGVASGMVAAVDVGGIGIWDVSAGAWEVANGSWPYMLWHDQDLHMHDVGHMSDGTLLAVSGVIRHAGCDEVGDCDPGLHGQLFASNNLGGTWNLEADSFESTGPTQPRVAAHRKLSFWSNSDTPGGRLIQPAGASAFVASHVPGGPAVVLREQGLPGAAGICALKGLPTPSRVSDTSWDGIVSALAWVDEPGFESLLVGYRQRDVDGTGTAGALFRCPFNSATPTCAALPPTCHEAPASQGLDIDVSDIELQEPGGYLYAYVSDYGRRGADAGAVTEPGVWRWAIDVTDPTGASDTVTDLTPPGGFWHADVDTHPVTGLLTSAGHVYAFSKGGRDAWYSKSPRLWRIDAVSAAFGAWTAWISLSEDQAQPAGEQDAEANVIASDTWMDDQVVIGNWAAPYDGIWYGRPGYLVGAGDVSIFGFDGVDAEPSPTDPTCAVSRGFDGALDATWTSDGVVTGCNDDSALAALTFFDSSVYTSFRAFQAVVVNDVAFGEDGRIHGVASDLGYFRQDVGDRARVPPQFETLTQHGATVQVVERRDGDGVAVWLGMAGDTVLRSDDDGHSWC